jgi:hypothetical protein
LIDGQAIDWRGKGF